jgi:hypothetical protein
MQDKRIWFPDETCLPFILEAAHSNLNTPVFWFTVPKGQVAVFTSITTGASGFYWKKKEQRIIFLRGFRNEHIDGVLAATEVNTHGALVNVRESIDGIVVNDNIAGFIFTEYSQTRPIRLVLENGDYTVFQGGILGAIFSLCFSGYCFPKNEPEE